MRRTLTLLLVLLALLAPAALAQVWTTSSPVSATYTPGSAFTPAFYQTDIACPGAGFAIVEVSGAAPPGLSLDTTTCAGGTLFAARYTGTVSAGASGPYSVMLMLADGFTVTEFLTVNFAQAFSMSGTAPNGLVGTSYSTTFSSSGGTAPIVWSVSAGALPAGLSLNPSTGVLSGTPSSAGAFSFTVMATDAGSATATSAQSGTIYPALSITTTTLPASTVGLAYSQTLAGTGGDSSYTWSLSAGALPTGLTLNPATGAISGTSSAPGTFTFTAQIACCTSATATQSLSITINGPPTITTSSLPRAPLGSAYSQTLAATGGTGSLTFTLQSGTLPTGLSLSSGGVISGTPPTAQSQNITIRVTDSLSVYSDSSFTLLASDLPTHDLTSLSPTTVGATANQTVTASQGIGPYTFSISAGTLPSGVSLNPSTGTLSGTPSAAGTASFTLRVTDSNSLTGERALTWLVNAAPTITTSSLPRATPGSAYSQTLATTGGTGTLNYSLFTGTLPTGLSLSSAGVISGTSTTNELGTFTVRVQDSLGVIGSASLTLLSSDLPTHNLTTLSATTVGALVSQLVTASQGISPYTFSISAGALPAGISVNPSTGTLSGTPSAAGTASFTLRVTDSNSLYTETALTWLVNAAPVITTSTLPRATPGSAYSQSLTTTGGTGALSYTLSAGALPTGLSLSSGGVISGTSTTNQLATFTVQVQDSLGITGTASLTLLSSDLPTHDLTTLSATTVGATVSQLVTASHGISPYTFSISAGALPAGITLNPSTGTLSGTPSAAGTASFTLRVTDSNSLYSQTALTWLVNGAPVIVTSALPRATPGASYLQSLSTTGGSGSLAYSLTSGTLPTGLSMSSAGVISGTSTTNELLTFTVQVQDSLGITGTATLSLLSSDLPTHNLTTIPATTVGASASQAVTASHGIGPYTFSISAGTLPAGITLNPSTGTLSGTPSAAGTASFTLRVTDSNSLHSETALTWLVNAAPVITTSTLPRATPGTAYLQSLTTTGGTGTLTYTVSSGTLPTGLTLSTAGVISGTSSTNVLSTFTVQVQDSTGVTGTASLTLLSSDLPTFDLTTLPPTTVGATVSQAVTASQGIGPYTFSISVGALPAGVTLNPSSGTMSGTPSAAGTASFTLRVTDSNSLYSENALTWLVNAAPVITTSSLPRATPGSAYSQSLTTTGGTGTLTYTLASGTLPTGLSLSTEGIISGTSSTNALATFTVQVQDSTGVSGTASLTLLSSDLPTHNLTTLSATTVGATVSQSVTASHGIGPYTFSISAGTLPAGITLDTSTGTLSGTPSAAGTASFTLRVTDSNSLYSETALTWLVNVPPSITTSTLPRANPGTAYSQALASTGGTTPYAYSITAGSLPAGLSLSSAGVISGSSSTNALATFTVQVQDAAGITATAALSLLSSDLPTHSLTSVAPTTIGAPVIQAVTASHGIGPYTFSITTGALPTGLTLDTSTGAITGTVSAAGTFPFTLRVTDSNSLYTETPLSWLIHVAPSITTTSLGLVSQGIPYSANVLATGGTTPYAFSITAGTLPGGLSMSAAGLITGTAPAMGVSNFTVQVTDAAGISATAPLSLNVVNQLTLALPKPGPFTQTQTVNLASSTAMGAPPYSYALAAGALPTGMTVNAATGALAGKITAAGTFSFTVRVTDSLGVSGDASATWLVNPPPRLGPIEPVTLVAGRPVPAYTLTASDGTPTYSWNLWNQPAGLFLSIDGGRLSGTPNITGKFTLQVNLVDSNGVSTTGDLPVQIFSGVSILTSSLAPMTAGLPATRTLTIDGGTLPYNWGQPAPVMPPGLYLAPEVGTFKGTPLKAGVYSIPFTITDANGVAAAKTLSLTVNAALTVQPPSAPATISINQLITRVFTVTGGTGVIVWTVGATPSATDVAASSDGQPPSAADASLPEGLFLSKSGVLYGSVAKAGTYRITVVATDSNGATSSVTWNLVVQDNASLTMAPSSLDFQAQAAGAPPAPQQITLTSTPSSRTVALTASAPWIVLSGASLKTPAVVTVSINTKGLAAGDYTGTITTDGTEPRTTTVALKLVPETAITLKAEPAQLTIAAAPGGATVSRLVVVHASDPWRPLVGQITAGAEWLAMPSDPSAWDSDVNSVVMLKADPAKLAAGAYTGAFEGTQPGVKVDVPVTLNVGPAPGFELSAQALAFAVQSGAASGNQTLRVINRGTGTLTWTAAAAESWLKLDSASGSATDSSALAMKVDPGTLAAGTYKGRVTVTSSGGESHSADVAMTVSDGPALPVVSPAALFFQAKDGAADPARLILQNNSALPLTYTAAMLPTDASSWLTVSSDSGTLPAGGSREITVQVSPGALTAGAYRAQITFGFADGTVRNVVVSLNVAPASCTASSLSAMVVAPGDHFLLTNGVAVPLEILVKDNCGAAVTGGTGLVRFSSGEDALVLTPGPGGLWTATWTPAAPAASQTLLVRVVDASGRSATTTATGTVQ